MKFCILKPVVWNDNGYQTPCGPISYGENFIRDYGYGHEEWNNTARMKHEGRAYFHSEALEPLKKKAQGNMCVLLIAAHKGNTYIVGVGAGVTANRNEDMPAIAATLGKYERWTEVWEVPLVRRKFNDDREAFLEHWKEHYRWIHWSCPQDLFYWFPQPVQFNPATVAGKQRVVTMFSRHQNISSTIAFVLLDGQLPVRHPILGWLLCGDFEACKKAPTRAQSDIYTRRKIRRGANRPTEMLYEYWVEGKRTVHPRHRILQDAFVQHLKAQGITCQQDTPEYIDLTYKDKNKLVITEIKPTESVGTKYAIRAAIGQLFEYRHTIKEPTALLHIVLDEKPNEHEIGFVKSLKFILSYKNNNGEFITV